MAHARRGDPGATIGPLLIGAMITPLKERRNNDDDGRDDRDTNHRAGADRLWPGRAGDDAREAHSRRLRARPGEARPAGASPPLRRGAEPPPPVAAHQRRRGPRRYRAGEGQDGAWVHMGWESRSTND